MSRKDPPDERTADDLVILDEVVRHLERLGVPWWLDQGSALGAVREGRFLPWDHDLDTSAFRDDLDPHRSELVRALHLAGYRVRSTPFVIQVVPVRDRFAATQVDIRLYTRDGDQARCSFRHLPPKGSGLGRILRRGWALGCGVVHRVLEVFTRALARASEAPSGRRAVPDLLYRALQRVSQAWWTMRVRGLVPTDFSVDASFFDAFEHVEVSGRTLPVPAEPERYLALKYGADWRTPKREWVYWKDDGALQSAT